MARKTEVEGARQRILRPVRSLIDSPYFRQRIKKARLELGVDPARRFAMQGKLKEWEQEAADSGLQLPQAARKGFKSDSDFSEELADKASQARLLWSSLLWPDRAAIEHYKTCLPVWWLWLPTWLYFNALCFDFEGSERDDFLNLALIRLDPVKMECWHRGLAPLFPFDRHLKGFIARLLANPNHIYLDVTEATLDDVKAQWDDVAELQKRMGIVLPGPGRPRGSLDSETPARILKRYDELPKYKQDRIRTIACEEHLSVDTVRGIIVKKRKAQRLNRQLFDMAKELANLSETMEHMLPGGLTPEELRANIEMMENGNPLLRPEGQGGGASTEQEVKK